MKNKKNFSRIAGNLDIEMERKLAKSKNKRIKRKASQELTFMKIILITKVHIKARTMFGGKNGIYCVYPNPLIQYKEC